MGNVNEILRRKSLLKDGVSETVYYGEPIEHPDMWKIEFDCTNLKASSRFLILYGRMIYKTIILNGELVLADGEITEAGRDKIWFGKYNEVSGEYDIPISNSSTEGYEPPRTQTSVRRKLWFINADNYVMYFTVIQRYGWIYNNSGVLIKSMRSPCEQYMASNSCDRWDGAFGGITQTTLMTPVDKRGVMESLFFTPRGRGDGGSDKIHYLFKKARVPIGSKAAYEAHSAYAGLEIEEFKFTPIPDN